MKATVIHASRYDFKDSGTGKTITGSKITFLDEPSDVTNTNVKGRQAVTMSAPYVVFDRFDRLPGEFDLHLSYGMSEGKPTVKLLDAAPIAKQ